MTIIGTKYVSVLGIRPFGVWKYGFADQYKRDLKRNLDTTDNRETTAHKFDVPFKCHLKSSTGGLVRLEGWQISGPSGAYRQRDTEILESNNFASFLSGTYQIKMWSIIGPGSYLNPIISGSFVGAYEAARNIVHDSKISDSYIGSCINSISSIINKSMLFNNNNAVFNVFIAHIISGNNVEFGPGSSINGAVIGNGVKIGDGVKILGNGKLDFRWEDDELRVYYDHESMIHIGDNVEIGANTVIAEQMEIPAGAKIPPLQYVTRGWMF
jgi:acetyltransferase-like isoleucine patch superfamily enzyme